MSLNSILTSLADLDADSRAKVAAALTALGGVRHDDSAAGDVGLVYDVVRQTLTARGVPVMPMASFRRTKYWASFRDGANTLADYVRTHVRPRNRVETRKAMTVLLKMLFRDFAKPRPRKGSIPVSLGSVAYGLKRIPQVVDVAFPLYRESGLLRVLVADLGNS